MELLDKEALLRKASYMYYMDNISQNQIAKHLDISKSTVSRMLQEARERGIVEITVHTGTMRCHDLEMSIKKKYKIKEAIIVPNYSVKEESIIRSLGKAGAEYLMHHIQKGMTIGFGLGKTLSEVANHIDASEKFECDVIPLVGGVDDKNPEVHANDICRRVAEKLGGTAYQLYTPAIVANKFLKKEMMSDPMIQNILAKMIDADIKMVGAGHVINSTFVNTKGIKKEESIEMKNRGVIGDITSWFINEEGDILNLEINERVVGHPYWDLRKQNERSTFVLVAGTWIKRDVIAAILKGNLIDVLITDEDVAKYLIDEPTV